MSELTEIVKVDQAICDQTDPLSQSSVVACSEPTETELKMSSSQLLNESTSAFQSTPSPSQSCMSSASCLRLNISTDHPIVLSADATNLTESDLQSVVQSVDASSCSTPLMPLYINKDATKGTVSNTVATTSSGFGTSVIAASTTTTSSSGCISGSTKLPSRTTQSPTPASASAATITNASTAIKRPRQKPSERRELLIRAVNDVMNSNMSMRRAAQKHNLAKSSLCDFVRKNKISLPNLRVKPCPSASGSSPGQNFARASASSAAGPMVTPGLKRMPPEVEEFHQTTKLACTVNRKPCVLNKPRDPGAQINEPNSSGRTNSSSANIPLSVFPDSPLTMDTLDPERSSSKSPFTHIRSGSSSSLPGTNSAMSNNIPNIIPPSPSTGSHTITSTRTSTATHAPKTNRIESPWYNAAGLPTQVPMRSWTVTHHPHQMNGTASTIGPPSTTTAERKAVTYNSLYQLRQTLDTSGMVVNLSDSNTQLDKATVNLFCNLTDATDSCSTETLRVRRISGSEDGEPGLIPNRSEMLNKHHQHRDSHTPSTGASCQELDMAETCTTSEVDKGTLRIEINGIGDSFLSGQSRMDSRPTSVASPQYLTDSTSTSTSSNVQPSTTSDSLAGTQQPQEFNSLVYSLPVGFGAPLTAVSSVGLGNAATACLNDVNWLVRSRESRLPIPNFDSAQLNLSSQPNIAPTSDSPVSIALGNGAPTLCPGLNQIASFNTSTVPTTPSMASFFTATELSATYPTAAAVIAALVLQQHSRNASAATGAPNASCHTMCPSPASIGAQTALPNLIGYPSTQLTYPIPMANSGVSVSMPNSNLATLYTPTLFSTPTDLTLPPGSSFVPIGGNTPVSGTRPASSRPASAQSGPPTSGTAQPSHAVQSQSLPSRVAQPSLSTMSVSDLLQQLGAEDLHTLLLRSANTNTANTQQPRTQLDSISSSSLLANALSTQLLPHLTYPALRHFLTTLVGSTPQKTVNLMSVLNNKPTNITTTTSATITTPVAATTAAVVGSTVPDNLLPSSLLLDHHHHHSTVGHEVSDTCPNLLDSNMSVNMTKLHSHVRGLVDFINKSPSPFHAVQSACELLVAHGFRELNEHEPWRLHPSDCVFVRKNGTTVIAAAIGGKFKPGSPFHIIGAHTDSPCLRLKPFSERVKEGYVQLGVETYGGGLWYTWFDRELKLAGRAVTANSSGRLEERLVHLDRPIACVPSLAIHLNQEIKVQGFQPNTEQHVVPILCTCIMDQVRNADGVECVQPAVSAGESPENCCTSAAFGKRRHPIGLIRLIAQELGVQEHELLELELYFADCQPARVGGLHNEFIHAPRLDNLFNSYTSLCGLIGSLSSLSEDSVLRLVCLYDHEEIGSTSTQGANSAHTVNILRRLVEALSLKRAGEPSSSGTTCEPSESDSEALRVLGLMASSSSVGHFEESLSKSFLLSADQAHAVHPSYHERHEQNHKAQLHGGLILKYNSTQRYATNALTAAAVRQIAQQASVPVQEFTPRQDMHCGSTIGPLLSSQLGVPTADVGFPQLAMHSCRELCCTTSVDQAVRFYTTFYEQMPKMWPPERP
ncbi:Aspartyl aminopeptidase [Fasciola gigantica]|uniref:Aspartyl aminopeptidase n=1 Tax=Fasciola gigantica TaxID=46835 RepID=A0A504Z2W1_FASGI|nr:Aspartyl aminopeptidase [Fasciola gigantica]